MKKNTLYYLEKAKGSYVSGEIIADALGVSRMTVSKEVAALRRDGAEIESSTKLGYRLVHSTDGLREESISALLPDDHTGDIYCFKHINSTNDYAKKLAADDAPDGTLVIAEEQSAGRGRYGRKFFSPGRSGLYMSVIIRPSTLSSDVMYTVAAAVAVRRVIAKYEKRAKIKWVNDIYIDEKKVCGILCEAVSDLESGALSAVICGIGVNLNPPERGFPDDIKGKAGFVSSSPISLSVISAEIVSELYRVLRMQRAELVSEYSEHLMLLGRRIYYSKNNESTDGIVKGVDADGGLIVSLGDGSLEILRSGEVLFERF